MTRALAACLVLVAACDASGGSGARARRERGLAKGEARAAAGPADAARALPAPIAPAPDEGCAAMTAVVTPPEGPAWLDHLRTPIDGTWLGRVGDGAIDGPAAPAEAGACVRLTGADIYRFTCRACHGPSGQGAPPEIPALIDPVRATSPALVRARFGGGPAPADLVTELTVQAKTSLLQRIRHGGERMPDEAQLSPDEEAALLQRLDDLAGVPASERGAEHDVPASQARVGELVVKGTCRVCHGARVWHGPRPENVGFEPSAPPFDVFPRLEPRRIVGQVMAGDNGWLGDRMPAFSYLSREEAEDVVRYLREHPPRRGD